MTVSSYSYLGPEGTFTERALWLMVGDTPITAVPQPDVVSALDAVRNGATNYAVVAIENSVEGGVTATLDTLANGSPLVILGEVLLPVQFELLARAGTELGDVSHIATHPHAWAQCRRWARATVPAVQHVPVASNTIAAAALGDPGRSLEELGFEAALSPPGSAERYGLSTLMTGVADNRKAVTRFVKVGPPQAVPARTGADKTTLVVHLPGDRAGALVEILEQFAARGVNLSRIESRPIGDRPGEYAFSIDAWGHIAEERVTEALIGLRRTCPLVLFLGSYPAANAERATPVAAGTTNEDFAAARAWVEGLRRGHHG